jgi:hypothetical protein
MPFLARLIVVRGFALSPGGKAIARGHRRRAFEEGFNTVDLREARGLLDRAVER